MTSLSKENSCSEEGSSGYCSSSDRAEFNEQRSSDIIVDVQEMVNASIARGVAVTQAIEEGVAKLTRSENPFGHFGFLLELAKGLHNKVEREYCLSLLNRTVRPDIYVRIQAIEHYLDEVKQYPERRLRLTDRFRQVFEQEIPRLAFDLNMYDNIPGLAFDLNMYDNIPGLTITKQPVAENMVGILYLKAYPIATVPDLLRGLGTGMRRLADQGEVPALLSGVPGLSVAPRSSGNERGESSRTREDLPGLVEALRAATENLDLNRPINRRRGV